MNSSDFSHCTFMEDQSLTTPRRIAASLRVESSFLFMRQATAKTRDVFFFFLTSEDSATQGPTAAMTADNKHTRGGLTQGSN